MFFALYMIVVDNHIIKKTSSGVIKVVSNEITISRKDLDVIKLISNGLFG